MISISFQYQLCLSDLHQMIDFFLPNSRALLPTFHTNCPDGSYFAQMGSYFAQNTTTNPCSLLCRHTPFSRICTYSKHPKPHPKTTLFLAWTWKGAKWTTVWENWIPTGQNVWKVGKKFLEVGKKKCSSFWALNIMSYWKHLQHQHLCLYSHGVSPKPTLFCCTLQNRGVLAALCSSASSSEFSCLNG